jgi:hypothetical protein
MVYHETGHLFGPGNFPERLGEDLGSPAQPLIHLLAALPLSRRSGGIELYFWLVPEDLLCILDPAI